MWSYCLKIDTNAVVSITEQGSFVCSATKNIAACLLQVNRQVYLETKSILYGENMFHIALNENSCMRVVEESFGDELEFSSAIPSLWTSNFRKEIYLIRHFLITVVLNSEEVDNTLTGSARRQKIIENKIGYANVVGRAVEEIYDILSLSHQIIDVYISLQDRSRIKTGGEYKVLQPLGMLRGLKDVHVAGVPDDYALYLQNSMKKLKELS